MPATTPNRKYPYPVPGDSIDVPRDIKALALAIDGEVGDINHVWSAAGAAVTIPLAGVPEIARTTPAVAGIYLVLFQCALVDQPGDLVVEAEIRLNNAARFTATERGHVGTLTAITYLQVAVGGIIGGHVRNVSGPTIQTIGGATRSQLLAIRLGSASVDLTAGLEEEGALDA